MGSPVGFEDFLLDIWSGYFPSACQKKNKKIGGFLSHGRTPVVTIVVEKYFNGD